MAKSLRLGHIYILAIGVGGLRGWVLAARVARPQGAVASERTGSPATTSLICTARPSLGHQSKKIGRRLPFCASREDLPMNSVSSGGGGLVLAVLLK